MEETQSSDAPPLFDNIDFNTSDQDYEIFESAVQQVCLEIVVIYIYTDNVFDQNKSFAFLFF